MNDHSMQHALLDAALDDGDAPTHPSPGKVSLTSRLAPRPGFVFRSAIAPETPDAPPPTVADCADPFGVHLLGGDGGVPLPSRVRELVETTTGAALGDVTVHAGPETADRASAMGARAFAIDQRIYLGAGASLDDTRLLVHEAVHTMQGGPAGGMSSPTDACEVEAERVADAALSGGRAALASSGGSSQIRRAVDPKVVGNIGRFDNIVNEVATRLRVPVGLVKGIIAAESGGNPDLVAKSGYTGLMQAARGEEQKDPKTSIETGVALFKSKAKAVGVTEADYANPDKITLVMIAYNAGEGTVKRAMGYARAAGDVSQWYAPEHFRRALAYYGAHNPATAIASQLRQLDGDALAAELKKVQQITESHGETPELAYAAHEGAEVPGEGTAPTEQAPEDPIRKKYFTKKGWNVAALRQAIVKAVEAERRKLRKTDVTYADVQTRASRWQNLSLDWKHTKGPAYANKVNMYKNAFENGTITKVTFDDSEAEQVSGEVPAPAVAPPAAPAATPPQ
jgi:hypothetical protein